MASNEEYGRHRAKAYRLIRRFGGPCSYVIKVNLGDRSRPTFTELDFPALFLGSQFKQGEYPNNGSSSLYLYSDIVGYMLPVGGGSFGVGTYVDPFGETKQLPENLRGLSVRLNGEQTTTEVVDIAGVPTTVTSGPVTGKIEEFKPIYPNRNRDEIMYEVLVRG